MVAQQAFLLATGYGAVLNVEYCTTYSTHRHILGKITILFVKNKNNNNKKIHTQNY